MNEFTKFELSAQQREALEKISRWYFDDSTEQVFRLFGYAGTGKTTLARHIVDLLDVGRVQYAAYTGKAAHVLRTKGCHDARTIHSLIYQPVEKARARLHELLIKREREEDPDELRLLERQILIEERKLATPDFILREDSELDHTDLLILDEVSMVGEKIAADLMSFGTKILVLGDPAQLPPIEGDGYFINREPDHLLTEIHRSALDSPVTRLATAVRNSTPGQHGYGASRDGHSGRRERVDSRHWPLFDQILVGRNVTRWKLIHRVREMRGLLGEKPVSGDRIIVLANSRENNVFNGQQFDVLDCVPHPKHDDRLRLQVREVGEVGEGYERSLDVWASGFLGAEGEKEARRNGRNGIAAATFAQAITTHKAQGSEWEKVLIVDESFVFAQMARKRANGNALIAGHAAGSQWLYTAVTRASDQVVIVDRL